MKRSPFRHLKSKWFILIVVIVMAGGAYAWAKGRTAAANFEAGEAVIGNVIERVSVTGTVHPVDKVDLAFQKSGAIADVYVKVGDPVKKGDRIASLDDRNDRAALASAQATLADASRNLTAAELAVQETAVGSARADALNASHDAFVKAQSALFNYTDGFFSNAQGPNPTISLHVDSVITQTAINQERLSMSALLGRWSDDLSKATQADAVAAAAAARASLSSMKTFMNDLAVIVNGLTPSNSGLPQSTINAYLATMNTGLANLNAAIDSVTTAQAAISAAQSNYDLKLAGNSSQSIAALSAKVAQAQVQVDQDTLLSPIDGVVTRADPQEGEFVAAGQTDFSMQDDTLKVEAYVPEADIAKVSIGDLASSTLDAYGANTDFPALVRTIDPSETVLEGVPTYKVTLVFAAPDSRIRSGMTANLDIRTNERDGVLTVPYRAVTDAKGQKTVRVVSADGKAFSAVPVTTGLKGSDGTIEITSGISAGDKVVTYVK